jgi:hypothetical protein
MGLPDEVRSSCRAVAETARFVSIDLGAARVLRGGGRRRGHDMP